MAVVTLRWFSTRCGWRQWTCFLIAAWLALTAGAAPAQLRESAVKAAFLYRFSAYVEWPPGAFQKADDPLVIAVSDDEVATDLEQILQGRVAAGRPVVVRRIREGAAASGAHILFIGAQRDGRLRQATLAASGPVLVVTEQEGGLQLGGVINFSLEGDRVRFSVSLASAEARNLKLSSRLLAVAQHVEARPR